MSGATAGALLRADGLQHPALALLQHVFLVMEAGKQLAWLKQQWKQTLLTACAALDVSLQSFMQCKSRKNPSITVAFGNCVQWNHHSFSGTSNVKCL